MTEGLSAQKPETGPRHFILTGFNQTAGIRVYAFEGVSAGRRLDYTVKVDLSLIPGYGIRIQDLPILCRDLLQQRVDPGEISSLTLTEEDMRSHAEKREIAREEASQKKKPPRHPANTNQGASWRPSFR
jgi:hypothetical protein